MDVVAVHTSDPDIFLILCEQFIPLTMIFFLSCVNSYGTHLEVMFSYPVHWSKCDVPIKMISLQL